MCISIEVAEQTSARTPSLPLLAEGPVCLEPQYMRRRNGDNGNFMPTQIDFNATTFKCHPVESTLSFTLR